MEKENTSHVEQSFKMASTISLNDIHRPLRFGLVKYIGKYAGNPWYLEYFTGKVAQG